MTPVVQLSGIHRSFPGVVALAGVDLDLFPGRIHALLGENGAGKSTLLNILAGLLQPDIGEIRVEGTPVRLADARAAWALGIVTVHQEVDLFADLTVTENIAWQHGLEGSRAWIDWARERRRTAEALQTAGAHLSPEMPASSLTPAQRQLVEVAGAVSRSARVLVLDEPTSSLSAAESRRLFEILKRFRDQGVAIVYVSHRLDEVFALADEVTVLRDGRRVWHGPIAATDSTTLIRHMVGRDIGGKRTPPEPTLGPVRLACRGMTAADGSSHEVTLEVSGGEVLGLYGLVGAGRSEWAQTIFGLRPRARGELRIEDRVVVPASPGQMARLGVAYVPEDRLREGLCRGSSVKANAVLASLRRLATLGWLPATRETRRATEIIRQLGVRCASLEQNVGTLSGGNQQKVVVGRWLERDPAVLILDEPTRGVDVGAREEIYSLVRNLVEQGRAIVLISSDLPEVMSQSNRIIVFRSGEVVATLAARETTAEEIARLAFPSEEESRRPGRQETVETAWKKRLPAEIGLGLFVALFFLALHLATGRFLQADSVRSLVTESALLGICALGAMLVLLAGGLDISLGALMALSAGVAGSLWEQGHALPIVVAVALGVGATGGAVNAALSLVGHVHPIVVTLGTMSVYRGLTMWWLGQDVQIGGERRAWANEAYLGIPIVAWLGVVMAGVAAVLLRRTVAGRELYALGSNPRAALRVGIRPGWVWLRAFSLQGALVGLAGLLYLARSGSLQPTSHEDRTLEAIAAAVVGGVAITGGRGTVLGLALGCLLLVSLGPACIFLGLSTRWQQALVGVVLLTAVLLDTLFRRRVA